MMGQNSWNNQLVREFVERCNWQGLPLAEPVLPSKPQVQFGLPTRSLSLQVTVQEFLQTIAWEGIPLTAGLTLPVASASEAPSSGIYAVPTAPSGKIQSASPQALTSDKPATVWLNQSVREFLDCCNWQGLSLTKPEVQPKIQPLQVVEPIEVQASWLMLSVSEFLDCCNWQGTPLNEPQLQSVAQPQPTLQQYSVLQPQLISWQSTVHDFFEAMSWEGASVTALRSTIPVSFPDPVLVPDEPVAQTSAIAPAPDNAEQNLRGRQSVQKFFCDCNWQGISVAIQQHQSENQCLSLGLRVQQFFQAIAWEGTPKIGVQPKLAPIPDENNRVNPISVAEMF